MQFSLQYNKDVFDIGTVHEISNYLKEILHFLSKEPAQSLAGIKKPETRRKGPGIQNSKQQGVPSKFQKISEFCRSQK